MHRVYQNPEFLRTVNHVPFDHETEQEAARRREFEASWVFARRQEREASVRAIRGMLGAMAFCLCFGGALYAAWCLL